MAVATWRIVNNTPWPCKVRVCGKNGANDHVVNPGEWVSQDFSSQGMKVIMAYNWQNDGQDEPRLVCCYPVKVTSGQNKWVGLHMQWRPNANKWWCTEEPEQEDPCKHPCGGSNSRDPIDDGNAVD